MNGIAGIVYPDPFQVSDLIDPMMRTIKKSAVPHTYTQNNVQLGSCAAPLAFNEKKSVTASFDGILYNAKDLQKELLGRGYHFPTGTPAEIIVHGYDLWGRELFKSLDGEFALAIYDSAERTLLIARDRIGKKSLFWFQGQGYFIYATQLKALLATGMVPQTPAPDALAAYFYFGYLPQDLTPIQEVSKLLPGHYLQYTLGGGKTIEPYWSYSSYFEHPVQKHKNTIARELDEQLKLSVKKRIPSEESSPLGCIVSGGLGSASIAYYVSRTAPEAINAFTVGFKGENTEDVNAAKLAASTLQLPQKVNILEPGNFADDLIPIIWHLDEPIADPNAIATWELARLAAQNGSRFVYSGMGSDELLAGHSRYTVKEQSISPLTKLLYLPMPLIRRLIPLLSSFNKPAAYKLLKMTKTNPWQLEYLQHNALFSDNALERLSPKLKGLFDPEVFLHKFYHINRIDSMVSALLYLDVKTRLADCFVLQYERLTQAHNLCWHAPFLDQQLVEYLAKMPEPQRLPESETATFLKVAMSQVFPPAFVNRPKVSRPHFLNHWIESPAIAELLPLLMHGTLVETGFLSSEWLEGCLKNRDTRCRSFRHLWAVLILELWFRLFINRAITSEPPSVNAKSLLLET